MARSFRASQSAATHRSTQRVAIEETFSMRTVFAIILILFFATVAVGQAQQSDQHDDMAGMHGKQHGQTATNEPMNMQPATFVQEIEQHATSGTSAEPDSTPIPMLM